jgi:putative solute:sodium symporter small subunit
LHDASIARGSIPARKASPEIVGMMGSHAAARVLGAGKPMTENEKPLPDEAAKRRYWKKNLRVLSVLLGIWFAVSYGCGILFVDALDRIRIPGTGFKLGFWFAQQGSIYCFVLLIAVYVRVMNKLDAELLGRAD